MYPRESLNVQKLDISLFQAVLYDRLKFILTAYNTHDFNFTTYTREIIRNVWFSYTY